MNQIKGILFDLDGTMFDTLPDIVTALNTLRREHALEPVHPDEIRPFVNTGSHAMLKHCFNIHDSHPDFQDKRNRVLKLYSENIAESTELFWGIKEVLKHLTEQSLPWGIVTNKPGFLTDLLLKTYKLEPQPHVVVSGDTLAKAKPHPDPILHACRAIKVKPENCLYIGDAKTDIEASKAAGSIGLVALYGYIDQNEDPKTWMADGYIQTPQDILKWL